jgi:hypothetical protein
MVLPTHLTTLGTACALTVRVWAAGWTVMVTEALPVAPLPSSQAAVTVKTISWSLPLVFVGAV